MIYLHEYGKITLGKLSFGGKYGTHQMTEVEMPANITDFESIEICAQEEEIDCSLMTIFFKKLEPILSNVNLWCNYDHFKFDFYDNVNEVPDFLSKLVPLINSIHSIHFFTGHSFDMLHGQFADKFFAAKIISINFRSLWRQYEWDYWNCTFQEFVDISWKPKMTILRKWLFFNGNDTANVVDQPRLLYVDQIHFGECHPEIDNISKEFMQSTKPTQFIVCFTVRYFDEEQRRNLEAILHVNQTTNEQLSVKCYALPNYDMCSCVGGAVFLHSHPIVPNGEEHEGNMQLINKIVEKMPMNKMEDKLFYSPNRHINIYRKGCKIEFGQ